LQQRRTDVCGESLARLIAELMRRHVDGDTMWNAPLLRLANIAGGSGARRLRFAGAGRDANGRMIGLCGPVEVERIAQRFTELALRFGGLFVKPDRVLHQLLNGGPQHVTRGIDRNCAGRPRAAGIGLLDDDAAKLTHAAWQAPRAARR
jgi:hypothetical protein